MQKVINGSTVRYWACINFSRSIQESTARGFCQQLVQICQISGMVKFQILVIPLLRSYILETACLNSTSTVQITFLIRTTLSCYSISLSIYDVAYKKKFIMYTCSIHFFFSFHRNLVKTL